MANTHGAVIPGAAVALRHGTDTRVELLLTLLDFLTVTARPRGDLTWQPLPIIDLCLIVIDHSLHCALSVRGTPAGKRRRAPVHLPGARRMLLEGRG